MCVYQNERNAKSLFCHIQNLTGYIFLTQKIFSEFTILEYMQELSSVIFSQYLLMNYLDDIKIESLKKHNYVCLFNESL